MKITHVMIALMTVALLGTAAVSFAGMRGGMGCGCGSMMGQSMDGGHAGMMMGKGHGKGHGKMQGGKGFMQNLTPEQQEKFGALSDAFGKKTEALRADMWAKHTELQALTNNPKVEPKYITKLVQELKELNLAMQAERTAFHAQVEKEVGIKNFGRGFGAGCMPAGNAVDAGAEGADAQAPAAGHDGH
ncbi:periplasmic heavy metal sensor [Desulfovibrio psychrotolerans]|uniref:Zinc resistance-associated protein n=1 Tax=Desulfovibrio psychrotolerans TaxID=415242 RepID=A0A7J0BZH2_9BACT|nr:periplasmic heavy metal sensor [Desulfovibrio psychrotolerans]GFM38605.1 zinc resistance-associated protein [Desulfovibrio psychrotolerans]